MRMSALPTTRHQEQAWLGAIQAVAEQRLSASDALFARPLPLPLLIVPREALQGHTVVECRVG